MAIGIIWAGLLIASGMAANAGLPALTDFTGAFGLGQIIWFVGLGLVLLGTQPRTTA